MLPFVFECQRQELRPFVGVELPFLIRAGRDSGILMISVYAANQDGLRWLSRAVLADQRGSPLVLHDSRPERGSVVAMVDSLALTGERTRGSDPASVLSSRLEEIVESFGARWCYLAGWPAQESEVSSVRLDTTFLLAAQAGISVLPCASVDFLFNREDYVSRLAARIDSVSDALDVANRASGPFPKSDELEAVIEIFPGGDEAVASFISAFELDFTMPPFRTGQVGLDCIHRDPEAALRNLVQAGAVERWGHDVPPAHVERLAYELAVVTAMGFAPYFLLLGEVVEVARLNDVLVGPGRGSAVASAICYCMSITDVDPVHHDLPFERFVNPSRVLLPDVDLDVGAADRDLLVRKVADRFRGRLKVLPAGEERRIPISKAIAAAGKRLGSSRETEQSIVAVVDQDKVGPWPRPTLQTLSLIDEGRPFSYGAGVDFRALVRSDDSARACASAARNIEGLLDSVHQSPGTIFMAEAGVMSSMPLAINQDGGVFVETEVLHLERTGGITLELLADRWLDVLSLVRRDVGHEEYQRVVVDDTNDDAIYQLLRTGLTLGLPGLESRASRRILARVQPTNLEELAIVVGLQWIGPRSGGLLAEYAGRRAGRFVHGDGDDPTFDELLASTSGVPIFQEDLMRCVCLLDGRSMSAADNLRKIVVKGRQDLLRSEREAFVRQCLARGTMSDKEARSAFSFIVRSLPNAATKPHCLGRADFHVRMERMKYAWPAVYWNACLSVWEDVPSRWSLYSAVATSEGMRSSLREDYSQAQGRFSIVVEDDLSN